MTECFEFWLKEDGNVKGKCCCNCRWQRPITAHPWNKKYGPPMQGSIKDIIGWGCTTPVFDPYITFFEKSHGMCEVHEYREDINNGC